MPSGVLGWALACAPVALLLVAVTRGVRGSRSGLLALACAIAVAHLAFGADWSVLSVASLKGLWLGTWIAAVVAPAVLVYGIVRASGWERIGAVLSSAFPDRAQRVLALAWLLPSLVQAVAGFGTPLAIATPLMLALGWRLPQALALPLIGYHWSVTFGSMGSSYFMASFTARLGASDQVEFAAISATMLGAQAVVAGALVLWLDGGWPRLRSGLPMLLTAGAALWVALVATAVTVPALASLAAASAGLVAALGMARRGRVRRRAVPVGGHHPAEGTPGAAPPARRNTLIATLPYVYLLLVALTAYGIPPLRRLVETRWVLAPDFPATATAANWVNEPVTDFTPLPLLGHPGTFLLAATTLAVATYLASGVLSTSDVGREVRSWARNVPRSVGPIVVLAVLAMVMVDAGMATTLARGLTAVTGGAYPLIAPWIGGLGSFLTGSTTTSNALFSSLQVEAATALDLRPTVLLAAQTVGGNVGNALSPIVILVGLASAHRPDAAGEVVRYTRGPVVALLALVSVTVIVAATILA